MDKQMIEEMAQCKNKYGFICCDCVYRKSCERYSLAEELYNAGYRKIQEGGVIEKDKAYAYMNGKISENAVVLSREEYEKLCDLAYFGNGEETIRKETAEKIFDKLYTWLGLEEIEKYGFVHIQKFDFLRKYREILKEITGGRK